MRATQERSQVRSFIGGLCARNASAEIHYGPTEAVRTARARLLALVDDLVCTDAPQNIGSQVALRDGDAVRVFALQDGMRYAFDSRVHSLRQRIRLNERRSIRGMALRMPTAVRQEQRRRDYRVCVAAYAVPCLVTPECAEAERACALDAPRFRGELANVSARGGGVVFPKDVAQELAADRMLLLCFKLPEEGTEFLVRAQVCHVRPVPGRATVMAGLRFLDDPLMDGRRTRRRLVRFVVGEQRRMLRRRK
jgi:c-di-GMP-binding flagellar brake protein YcgR